MPSYDSDYPKMFQLDAPVHAEIEIRKSRFIALLYPVTSRAAAEALIAAARRDWPDARHYCAVLLTASDSMLNDDGEPGGTAARPMYNVLQHKGLVNVLALVVRYFGGIKLGAGGLARAYGQAVSQALADARLVPVTPMRERRVSVPFALESALRRRCQQAGIAMVAVEYGEAVVATLSLEAARAEVLLAALGDELNGALTLLPTAD